MLLGLSLLYVGAVLILNGLWLLDRINSREIVFINLFAGIITFSVAFYSAFGPGANDASIKGAALTLLFSATYLWVAYNQACNADGRGLGWFCLFVALTAVPVAIQSIAAAAGAASLWLGANWALGHAMVFFFLLLALEMPIVRPVGYFCLAVGVVTAWIPGFLLLDGQLA